jgi:predicted patatin/cPLA2 family phospholipase
MEVHVDVELCEPAPFIYGDNGQLAVTDGANMWLVIVTEEAMNATASPPEASLKRLVRYAELYRGLAEAIIARGEGYDGKVWIFEKDVVTAKQQLNASAAEIAVSH